MMHGVETTRFVRAGREQGEGKALVVIRCDEGVGIGKRFESLTGRLSTFAQVLEFSVAPPQSGGDWRQVSDELDASLVARGIRHCPIVGVGEGAIIAHYLAVYRPKLCQSLILIDPVFERLSTWLSRLVDRIERVLPLGLPLRVGTDSFLPAPFLHRIRCPTLVVSSRGTGVGGEDATALMTQRIPNGWYESVKADAEVADCIRSFLPVRHRYPMRRGGQA